MHNGNGQLNEISIDNIILHREWDGSLKIGVCNLGSASHMGENIVSLWYVEIEKAKENLKENGRWYLGCLTLKGHMLS